VRLSRTKDNAASAARHTDRGLLLSQRDTADQAASEARARLVKHFRIAGSRVALGAEHYVHVLEHRSMAIAYARTKKDNRRTSWQHQARLQRVLNTGVAMPLIVTGSQILDHCGAVDRLLVDPTVDELLVSLTPPTEGP